jgi:hypothetical protein
VRGENGGSISCPPAEPLYAGFSIPVLSLVAPHIQEREWPCPPLFLRWSPTRERQRQPPWPRPPPRSPQPMNSLHSYASTSVFSAPAHSRASRASLRQPPASPVAARGDCRRRPTPVVPPGSASILLTCRRSNRPSLDRRRPAGLCIAWTRHLSASLQRPSSALAHADRATPNFSCSHTNPGHAPPFPGYASRGLLVGDLQGWSSGPGTACVDTPNRN